ncbi:MAG: cadmium-translocating P-type ATPase [Oscillospiraceae bacterium]|nr:cadmium-translocating P-type ATPase [Oscillospiraceae bacterium]
MKKQTKRILQISFGSILMLIGNYLDTGNHWLTFGIYMVSYIIAGGDIVLTAIRYVISGQVFNESFLMTVATIGAFAIGEYPEGVAVMLFYKVGELLQSYAVDKSRKSISGLMDMRPDYANLVSGEDLIKVEPEAVKIGDIIKILPGERVPLDGLILEGSSSLDTSALTGESLPRDVYSGGEVLSGCININGLLTVEVTREFENSTVGKILDLVENAAVKKAKTENFITKFAKFYTPVVVALAALISILPPLLLTDATFNEWIYRGLTFLVISCPCALVVSVPLSFFGGIGGASKNGILIKGGNYLEAMSQLETVVFDKTGTLTKGVFTVQKIVGMGINDEKLLELAAYAEYYSNHPISASIIKAYGQEIDISRIVEIEEFAGLGIKAQIDETRIAIGNARLMERLMLDTPQIPPDEIIGTIIHVAIDNVYSGYIVIADEIKADSKVTINMLKEAEIKKTVMLTGDTAVIGEEVGKEIGIDFVYSALLPGDKVEKFEQLLLEKSPKKKLAYVGDGINDAPVLARADVGIAMGGLGSDAAIEAADVVIMSDEPSKLIDGIKISKKTLSIVKQNIYFTLIVKFSVLTLAALGFASMWAGVMADVGVTVIAVLNSVRTLGIKSQVQ